jgi:hypothetical protein
LSNIDFWRTMCFILCGESALSSEIALIIFHCQQNSCDDIVSWILSGHEIGYKIGVASQLNICKKLNVAQVTQARIHHMIFKISIHL